MTTPTALACGLAVMLAGAALTYTPAVRSHPRAWVAFVAVGGLASFVWCLAVRGRDQAGVYRLAVWWDALMVLAYYVAPAVAAGVRLTPGQWAGAALVVAGVVLVHAGGAGD